MAIFEQDKALFHNVDHHYSVISELCTADSCPTMTGPGSAVFLWVDERGKKIKCSAPQYIGQFESNGHTWANREPLRHMMFSWLIIKMAQNKKKNWKNVYEIIFWVRFKDSVSDYVMAHCQQLVTAQDVFPTKYEQNFSSEFRTTITKMLKLLWHVVCKL